jgi:hypothetical protein
VLVQLCLVWADFTLELPILEIEKFWGLVLVIFQQFCFGVLCAALIPDGDPNEPIDERLPEMGFLWGIIGFIGWWLNDFLTGIVGLFQTPHDWKLLWFFMFPHAWIAVITYIVTMMIVWLSVRKILSWCRHFKTASQQASPQIIEALAIEEKIATCPKCGKRNRVFVGDGRHYRCGQCKTLISE